MRVYQFRHIRRAAMSIATLQPQPPSGVGTNMTTKKMLVGAFAASALIASPVQAHKPDGDHGKKGQGQERSEQAKTKRCEARTRTYVAHGSLVSHTLTKNADGSYDGTITVKVRSANKSGKAHKGTSQTYTLDDGKVVFGKGATGAAGERVKVKGTVTRKHKHCATTATSADPGPVTVKKVTIRAPKAASKS